MSDPNRQKDHILLEALRLLGNQYEASADFNVYFDGEEPLSIPSPRPDMGAYQYERSKVLFWLDRDAYDDEREAWENDANQARHQEATERLRFNGSIVPFQDLIDAVERARIVPFIGAGLSKPIGMPL